MANGHRPVEGIGPKDRWWLPLAGLAGAFGVVMVAALAALLLSGVRSPVPTPAPATAPIASTVGSADDAVMGWAKAMEAHDYQAADSYLSQAELDWGDTSAALAQDATLIDLSIYDVLPDADETEVMVHTNFELPSGEIVDADSAVWVVPEDGTWKLDSLPLIYGMP